MHNIYAYMRMFAFIYALHVFYINKCENSINEAIFHMKISLPKKLEKYFTLP